MGAWVGGWSTGWERGRRGAGGEEEGRRGGRQNGRGESGDERAYMSPMYRIVVINAVEYSEDMCHVM